MNYKQLLKILIEWSIQNKNYDMVYFIYSNFNIGIPVSLLYQIQNKTIFNSLDSFFNNHHNKQVRDENLKKLFELFKKSKYKRLSCWNNHFGYSLL